MKIKNLLFSFTLIISWSLSAQVSINFSVNMNYQEELGIFNPSSDFVDIAGTFNGWGGTLTKLDDTDGDGIYTKTIGGFSVGQSIEFKFRQNGMWDGTEEFPNGGANRTYTVVTGDNDLSFWYNNEATPGSIPTAAFNTNDNRIYEDGVIHFFDQSTGEPTSYKWTFQGGQPSSSTEKNPQVYYSNTGTFDVTLEVSNDAGMETKICNNLVTVEERDRSEIESWNDAVYYEIFVRSFYDSDGDGIGDFQGLTSKLDYLNDGDPSTDDDLGVTGIWLMPIHDSPSYHGYDVTDYRSINPDYGTMQDFEDFLDAAHERGIKVIIDYVMNHSSQSHPWFINALGGASADKRNWYRWSSSDPNYNGPWGQEVWHNTNSTGYYYGLFWSGMPDLNYDEPAVRTEMFDIADYWLDEVGVDGFRLDAVKFILEDGTQLENTDGTFEFWKDFRDHYKATNSNAFTVGEAWTSTNEVRKYVEDDGLDFCFEFDVAYNIINAINTGDAKALAEKLQKAYNVYPHLQYGTFVTNHDQNRVMNEFANNEDKVKTAASIYLTSPGVPFIYYGEEIGMNGQKPDELIRRPMQWSAEDNAGFSTGNPWNFLNNNYETYNVADEEIDPNSILSWYKKLIHLRNQEVTLRRGDMRPVSTNKDGVLAFVRQLDNNAVLVLVNVSGVGITDIELDVAFTDIQPGNYVGVNLINDSNTNIEVKTNQTIEGLSLGLYETAVYKLDNVLPIAQVPNKLNINYYPNPTSSELIIELPDFQDRKLTYTISSTLGQICKTGNLRMRDNNTNLNIKKLPSGIYFFNFIQEGIPQSFQFIKE